MTSVTRTWGTTPDERLIQYPCDGLLDRVDDLYWRGITIHSPPDVIYKWLCQMRVAPYSYDWLDNLGRQSPQRLTPGLDELAVGQSMMFIFEVVSFERDRHVTIRIKNRLPGAGTITDCAISYLIAPVVGAEHRLLAKLVVKYPGGPLGPLMRLTLPGGDLIMMRRQLLNFKRLCEKTGE